MTRTKNKSDDDDDDDVDDDDDDDDDVISTYNIQNNISHWCVI